MTTLNLFKLLATVFLLWLFLWLYPHVVRLVSWATQRHGAYLFLLFNSHSGTNEEFCVYFWFSFWSDKRLISDLC